MTIALEFAALGLGTGAIYALLATGIVVIYRASGVLNLAQGALAMIAGSVYYSVHVGLGWAFAPAGMLSIALVSALALLMSLMSEYRLRESSGLIKLIATVAVLLTLEAAAPLIWGSQALSVPSTLPTSLLHVGSVRIGADRLILLLVALILTVCLTAVSTRTRFGVATSAAAENRRAIASLGWSPGRLSTVSWLLGGALAALAGVLVGPISGIAPADTSLLVVPALAVALLSNFRSFWLTLLAAVVLGVAQSEMANYAHSQGWADSLPFIVIAAVLVLRGRRLPDRGFVNERLAQFGTGRVRPLVVVPALLLLCVLITSVFGENLVDALCVSIGFSIVGLSIVVVTGYAGQLSLAQMAIAGVGALIAGRLVAASGVTFILALVLGVAGAAVASLAFALPALRTRGATLAVVTLGLGVTITALFFDSASISGGLSGTTVLGKVTVFGLDIDPFLHPNSYAIFALVCLVLSALVVTNVRRGAVGRALIAVRSNERAAAALGVSVTASKVYAFALSAAIAALGGIVLAFLQPAIVYTDTFDFFQSILVVAYVVIGGVGFVAGALLAGLLPSGGLGDYALTTVTGGVNRWIPLVAGVALLLTIVQNPNGVASTALQASRRLGLLGRQMFFRRPRSHDLSPPVPRERVTPLSLRVAGVSVRFGQTRAVQQVSLQVSPGEVVGLIGPNGAGKTTLIDAISGFVPTFEGDVVINDRHVGHLSAERRAQAGIGRSFQSLELFEDITVRENLQTASDERKLVTYFTTLVAPRNRPLPPSAVAAIRDFELEDDLDRFPDALSYGRRRLVAVARTVASGSSIVLLDEPAAGLSGEESLELSRLVRRLADEWGIGVLVVEHDMNFVMGVCDKVVVLDFGRQIATGTPAEIVSDDAVVAAYLGSDDANNAAPPADASRQAGRTA